MPGECFNPAFAVGGWVRAGFGECAEVRYESEIANMFQSNLITLSSPRFETTRHKHT